MGPSDLALYVDMGEVDQAWAENLKDGMQTSILCLVDLLAYHCLVRVSSDCSPFCQDEFPEG